MYNSGSPYRGGYGQQQQQRHSPNGNDNGPGTYRPHFPPPYQTSPPLRFPPTPGGNFSPSPDIFRTSTPRFYGERTKPYFHHHHRHSGGAGGYHRGNNNYNRSREGNNNSWHNHSSPRNSDASKSFNVQDYISASCLEDPWMELEAARAQDKQAEKESTST